MEHLKNASAVGDIIPLTILTIDKIRSLCIIACTVLLYSEVVKLDPCVLYIACTVLMYSEVVKLDPCVL